MQQLSTKSTLFLILILLSTSVFLSAQKEKADTPKHYLDTISLSGLSFRAIGPALTSGRIADIAVHPDNNNIYYVATASGGVWKTTNAGTTFTPIFDSQGSYSIGCVTIDPNNPNVIWVGTGENNNQRSVAYGDGIYKSEDGGQTWSHMGLKDSEHIGKIIVHPDNSQVIFVAAIGPLWRKGGERGVYKTIDGGQNWELVLSIDEHTGVTDLIMDPRDPDVLYAAAYQRRRHVFTYVGGGPGSGIYKTANGGQLWEKASDGLPSGDIGRIGLAISPADPEILYATVEAQTDGKGFYRSTNRAASWEKRNSYSTSGNYYSEIIPHPTNPDIVFSMDTWMHWTTDGGKSFSKVNEEFKHVDNHSMWVDPKDTDHYIVGCDGGIYESFDKAKTWRYIHNLSVTQFYKVEVDNDLPFYNVYGGTQDNFSIGGPSRTRNQHGIVNADWFITNGGDGFESQIDPNDPNIIYAQSQYGVLYRYDKSSGERTGIQPKPGKGENSYRWNWDAPLAVSAHKPTRIFFAANKLFKSDNRGDRWETISPDLTAQIDRNTLEVMGRVQSIDAIAKNASTSPYGTIVAFSESPLNENLLYVGTDDGLIQITTDCGKTWTKIDNIRGVPDRTYVNFLLASQHDENVVYAAFNHHKYGDFKPYVFKSTDKGKSWKAITNNLPERGSSYSIAEDHIDPNLLFVGTEFGCFFTNDGGQYWKQLKAGLPTIAVRDIAIQKRENDLVLGTFGRGFYVLDDYSPLRQIKEEVIQKEAAIFPIKEGLLYIEKVPLGIRDKSFQGHSFFTAPNPPVGASFYYYVKDAIQTIKEKRQAKEKKLIEEKKAIRYPSYAELEAERQEEAPYLLFTIKDLSGEVVRQLKTSPSKGVNQITWDGRFPSVSPVSLTPVEGSIFGNRDQGVLAMPGAYTVTLSKSINGMLTDIAGPTPFTLKTLGGVTLETADRNALVEFQKEAQDLQRVVLSASRKLGELKNRFKYIQKAVLSVDLPSPDLMAKVQNIKGKLYSISKEFGGDGIASTLDKEQPYPVASRVGGLVYSMWNSTSAPTQTQRDALEIAQEELPPLLKKISDLEEQDFKDLEQAMERAGAPYTPSRKVEYGNQ